MIEDWQHGGFGLYIHWPFCQSKCPYCDFNSHVAREIDHKLWLKAYLSEIDRVAALTPHRILDTVFFGGGTPSLMEPWVVAEILSHVRRSWPMGNDPEITLEANPGSVDAFRFRDFSQAGVSRVSMGIQALNNRDLQRLGRLHSVEDARNAFDIARNAFDRVSFDLIYARQDQTLDEWRAELTQALSMAVDHLSMYQLTVEQGTAFGDRFNIGKLMGLPTDDLAADMFDLTQDICGAHGMPAYEVSNHAKTDAESRHNLVYWRYGDYAGIGPGAHGRLTLGSRRYATEAFMQPAKWLDSALSGNGDKLRDLLDPQDEAVERLMMGLRLSEGIDIERHPLLFQEAAFKPTVLELLDDGFLTINDTQLKTTRSGRLVLNAVTAKLLDA